MNKYTWILKQVWVALQCVASDCPVDIDTVKAGIAMENVTVGPAIICCAAS